MYLYLFRPACVLGMVGRLESALETVLSKLLVDCAGHYGHIKLELPVFHIGYFKHTLTTLQVSRRYYSAVALGWT